MYKQAKVALDSYNLKAIFLYVNPFEILYESICQAITI